VGLPNDVDVAALSVSEPVRYETRNPAELRSLLRSLWPLGAPVGAVVVLATFGLGTGARVVVAALICVWFVGTGVLYPGVGRWLVSLPFHIAGGIATLTILGLFEWFATARVATPVLSEEPASVRVWRFVILGVALIICLLVWRKRASLTPLVASIFGFSDPAASFLVRVTLGLIITALYSACVIAVSIALAQTSLPIEWSRDAIYVALGLFALAGISSLLYYAITRIRVLVALAIAFATVLLALKASLPPPDSRIAFPLGLAWPLGLVAFAVTLCALEGRLWYVSRSRLPAAVWNLFYRTNFTAAPSKIYYFGFASAMLSAIAILLSSSIARSY
jgi:hypothetical protein